MFWSWKVQLCKSATSKSGVELGVDDLLTFAKAHCYTLQLPHCRNGAVDWWCLTRLTWAFDILICLSALEHFDSNRVLALNSSEVTSDFNPIMIVTRLNSSKMSCSSTSTSIHISKFTYI
jgi:hypothetical protein